MSNPTYSYSYDKNNALHIQGGPAKVRPTYILLVTFGT